jgi:hypothetical protein
MEFSLCFPVTQRSSTAIRGGQMVRGQLVSERRWVPPSVVASGSSRWRVRASRRSEPPGAKRLARLAPGGFRAAPLWGRGWRREVRRQEVEGTAHGRPPTATLLGSLESRAEEAA